MLFLPIYMAQLPPRRIKHQTTTPIIKFHQHTVPIKSVSITSHFELSDQSTDIYPPKHHNVSTSNTFDGHPQRPWSTTIWPFQASWALLILWGAQIPILVSLCGWQRGNEETHLVVHWLWYCRTLGNPSQVCQCICTLSRLCQHHIQAIPWIRHGMMLVNHGHG